MEKWVGQQQEMVWFIANPRQDRTTIYHYLNLFKRDDVFHFLRVASMGNNMK